MKEVIEGKKEEIKKLLEGTNIANRFNENTTDTNAVMQGEADQRKRHITVLEDQNIELEAELDGFLISDAEIRAKLQDRDRSPLQLDDLLLKHSISKESRMPPGKVIPEPGVLVDPHSRVEIILESPYPVPPRRLE